MKTKLSKMSDLVYQKKIEPPFVTIALTNDYALKFQFLPNSDPDDAKTDGLKLEVKQVFQQLSMTNIDLPRKTTSLPLWRGYDLQPLTVIMGDSRSGKTTLMKYLFRLHNDDGFKPLWLNYLEFEDDDMITCKRQLSVEIVAALLDPSVDVIIIDSFRALVYASGKAAGAGGIDKNIFAPLTALAHLARKLSKYIIISINVMSRQRTLIEQYHDDLTSSVPTTILADNHRYSIYDRSSNMKLNNLTLPGVRQQQVSKGRQKILNTNDVKL